MATESDSGRVNQKRRTHVAIVDACRTMIRGGGPVTMPEVARAALVSEATAYRYFPDLISLLNEAFVGMWPSPADALKPVAHSRDPVERVAFASADCNDKARTASGPDDHVLRVRRAMDEVPGA